MTIGKTIALIRWTFVGKVMSLLFHMLSRLVIKFTFLTLNSTLNSRLEIKSNNNNNKNEGPENNDRLS